MPIHKVIFRLDYKMNFGIIDEPGTVMSLLGVDNPAIWQVVQDAPQSRLVSAIYKEGDRYIQMSVDPGSINFIIERSEGIDIDKLEADKDYSRLLKLVHLLCDRFHVVTLKRAGIRFVALSHVGDKEYNLASSFERTFSEAVMNGIRSAIGNGSDYGILIDGSHPDKSKYHLRFGPYVKGEARQKGYIEHLEANDENCNLYCDIDLFEEAFTFEGITPVRWAKPFIVKASKMLKELEVSLVY